MAFHFCENTHVTKFQPETWKSGIYCMIYIYCTCTLFLYRVETSLPDDYLCQFSNSYIEASCRNSRITQPAKFAVEQIFDQILYSALQIAPAAEFFLYCAVD